jgi:hypothetical protein
LCTHGPRRPRPLASRRSAGRAAARCAAGTNRHARHTSAGFHLRFKAVPLAGVIVASWLIAFVEYGMAVPANRWGSAVYSTAQLKTAQEVITLLVFAAFSVVYLREPITLNHAVGFALIAAGAFFVFRGPL